MKVDGVLHGLGACFVYWRNRRGKWYWHFRAKNGKIVGPSEGYSRRIDCMHAIELIRATDASTPVVSRDGLQPTRRLLAAPGRKPR